MGLVAFSASWPSVFESNLLPAYILRKIIWIYNVVSIVLLISCSVAQISSQTFDVLVVCLAVTACVLLFSITLLEFEVCGVVSFRFSMAFVTTLSLIVVVSGGSFALLLVLLPTVWIATSSLLHFVCGCFVLPAQFSFNGLGGRFPELQLYDLESVSRARSLLLEMLNGESLTLRTADGAHIDTMFFASHSMRRAQQRYQPPSSPSITSTTKPSLTNNNNTNTNTNPKQPPLPTVILFNGNNESFELKKLEIEMYLHENYSVLVFNYRGVSDSKGFATRDGIVLDADACYQFVHSHLHIPPHMIFLIGTSLGAAIATEIAAIHKGCVLCNDRSFSCLALEAQEISPSIFHLPRRSCKGRFVSRVAVCLLCYCGWELHAQKQWHKVTGYKMLMFHSEDMIVPERARLYTALKHEPTLKVLELMPEAAHDQVMPDDVVDMNSDECAAGQFAHCRALNDSETAQHFLMLHEAMKTSGSNNVKVGLVS